MTTHNKKTPAGATNTAEGNELLGTGSTVTAYIAKHGDNTRHTLGTWSGVDLPIGDYITVIIPFRSAQDMYADGPQLIAINTACADAQSAAVRKKREEKKAQEVKEIRRRIASQVEEEEGFKEKLAALDQQATAIYDQIDARVDAILNNEEMAPWR